MDLVTLKIICLFTRIVIFRIDLALQYIFDTFLSLSLRWLQKILVPGLMVVGMESYKCLAPPMEPLDQVDKIVQIVTKSQDHQLVCANSTTWAHLPMSGWRTHPQFCLPGQRWLPWPSPALKHIPGPNQCQCWRKRLASTNMHFRKRPVIRHRTPCWCPSKMPLISPLHIRWASSYQSLSQLRLTKKYIKVYSSGQYSIASQHYDPELSTVSVTVPDLSYHFQVLCRNKFVCCCYRNLFSMNATLQGSEEAVTLTIPDTEAALTSSDYRLAVLARTWTPHLTSFLE